ncbi:hypothetical protein [Exiguobacterium sp. s102]|uniref:hypothetical protein n=1 Tax=Exiguobacterium sp. s102 TaxID=2751212 RepID=UPI001BE6EC56|nr:hypothetical protein [Exiguobacterium sp. s102]
MDLKRFDRVSGLEALDSGLTIEEILNEAWFVKKPFDVRAEMLARPNEWVGAFKVGNVWHRVGFSTEFMTAYETFNKLEKPDGNLHASAYPNELDRCIPIEDIPKEELT